ncbi:MAG: hypothetical protein ACJ8C4_01370 [Gemmataceae bacterium]
MTEYPPKLVEVTETEFGAVLALNDGRSVPINIRPERLDQSLRAYQRPSLRELLASRSLSVYADTWQTLDGDWERVSEIILASPVAMTKLQDFPGIWRVSGQPSAAVRDMPQRVYGGLDRALYTSHAFQFRENPNRSAPWCRGLLNAQGGWIFETWVHLGSGQVEIVGGVLQGHFVE